MWKANDLRFLLFTKKIHLHQQWQEKKLNRNHHQLWHLWEKRIQHLLELYVILEVWETRDWHKCYLSL